MVAWQDVSSSLERLVLLWEVFLKLKNKVRIARNWKQPKIPAFF
jgi:hypothetical protein